MSRVAPASQMLLEDNLKRILSKQSTAVWRPYDNNNLAPVAHSAFGDFPKDYMRGISRSPFKTP